MRVEIHGVIPQLQDIAEDLVTFLFQKGQLLPAPSTASRNPDPVAIRGAMGLSQTKFAQLIGVSVRTLHKWEQHTSSPSGAAKTLLKIAATNPHSVYEALVQKGCRPWSVRSCPLRLPGGKS